MRLTTRVGSGDPRLPPETSNSFFDLLLDEPQALKHSHNVASSPNNRFRAPEDVDFPQDTSSSVSLTSTGGKRFPDSANSSAYGTRSLSFASVEAITAVDAEGVVGFGGFPTLYGSRHRAI